MDQGGVKVLNSGMYAGWGGVFSKEMLYSTRVLYSRCAWKISIAILYNVTCTRVCAHTHTEYVIPSHTPTSGVSKRRPVPTPLGVTLIGVAQEVS